MITIFSDEYKPWLKTLREGDEVAYDSSMSYHRSKYWRITRIVKITPTDMFRLANGDMISADGRVRGKDMSSYHIQPVTDEIREFVRRERVLDFIRKTQWDKLPTDVLEHIEAWILFEEGQDAKAKEPLSSIHARS